MPNHVDFDVLQQCLIAPFMARQPHDITALVDEFLSELHEAIAGGANSRPDSIVLHPLPVQPDISTHRSLHIEARIDKIECVHTNNDVDTLLLNLHPSSKTSSLGKFLAGSALFIHPKHSLSVLTNLLTSMIGSSDDLPAYFDVMFVFFF